MGGEELALVAAARPSRPFPILGLVWSQELGTSRGLEATPIVEGGVIYTTGSWSVVFAFEARTGEMKWNYDPRVPCERAYSSVAMS